MFEDIETDQLLKDLLCIKLPPEKRKYLILIHECLKDSGFVPVEENEKIRDIASLYRKKLKELYAAREKARISNGLRSLGIKRSEFNKNVKNRLKYEKLRRNDVGF